MVPLRLFGAPGLIRDEEVVALPATKSGALLAYLAQRGGWVARVEVAVLFWPDSDDPRAHHALRQLVYRTRRLPWVDALEATEDHLRWSIDNDVLTFRACVASADWEGAVAACGGAFLDGLLPTDAPGFEAWLELERAELHRLYLDAVLRAAAAHELRRHFDAGVALLEAAWARDPWAEEVVQALLRCLALAGRPSAAAATYERYRERWLAETGLEPSAATRELAERLREGVVPASRPHNLRSQATPFVGRARELREIARRIAEPSCRLLTVTGPGGIGKTRLALQAAAHQVGTFRHGVFVVPLASVGTLAGLVAALSDAVGVASTDRGDPTARLLAALRERELLLVLDNLEQLRAEGPWLSDLLARSSGVTVLATSREPLGLAGEWVLPLSGLDLPSDRGDGAVDDAEASGGVELFVQGAERVRPGFASDPLHRRDVARVCRLVAGVPLAIELAAAWAQLLSPAEIAREIERDLDFLRSESSDVPDRHQSMRRVFETSWERAAVAEREVAMRLAPFVGDVDLESIGAVAGEAVAGGGTLRVLRALTERSFLRRNAAGRFEMHPLVRQYIREALDARADLRADAHRRHALHVAGLIAGSASDHGGDPAFERLQRLLPDGERAWQTLLALRAWGPLCAMLPRLFEVHDLRSRSHRFLAWLERALERHPPGEALGRLLAHRSGCLQRLGRYAEVERDVTRALELLADAAPAFEHWVAWRARGNAAYLRGELDAAAAAFREALAVAERLGHRRGVAGGHSGLGLVHKELGDLKGALAHLRRARALAEDLDDGLRSQVLNNLATVQSRRGATIEAEALLRESAALKRGLGDDRGLASVLTNLGNLRMRAGDHPAAERHHREALRFAEAAGDPSGIARAHTNLGDLARARDDLPSAVAAYERSLALKLDLDERAGVVEAYASLAACHRRLGDAPAEEAAVAAARAYSRRSAARPPPGLSGP